MLHDDVAIGLAALAVKLGAIAESAGNPTITAEFDAARDSLSRVIDYVRDIGAAIYPPVLAYYGLGPVLRSIAERRDLRLRLDLPRRELHADARIRTALLVVDHLHTLCPGTFVKVRVRGRRFVRVRMTETRSGGAGRRERRAVLRCE